MMCGPDMGLWCMVLVDGLKISHSEPSVPAGMAVMLDMMSAQLGMGSLLGYGRILMG